MAQELKLSELQINETNYKQKLFDFVLIHLRKQGCVSRAQDIAGFDVCKYRGPKGTMCAIGALIADEHYKQELEGMAAVYTAVVTAVMRSVNVEEPSFYRHATDGFAEYLQDLQRSLHDGISAGRETFLTELEVAARTFAREYGLSYTISSNTENTD